MAEAALHALSAWTPPSEPAQAIVRCSARPPSLQRDTAGAGSFAARAFFQLPDGGRFAVLLSGDARDDALMPIVEDDLGLPDGFLMDINTFVLTDVVATDRPLPAARIVHLILQRAHQLFAKRAFVAPPEPPLRSGLGEAEEGGAEGEGEGEGEGEAVARPLGEGRKRGRDARGEEEEEEEAKPSAGTLAKSTAVAGAHAKRKRAASSERVGEYAAPQFGTNRLATTTLMKQLAILAGMDTRKEGFLAEPAGDDLYTWDVKLFFDDVKSSRIAADLMMLPDHDCITMEFRFPADYPIVPPVVRVVSPYVNGGHVLSHGGICMELLTTTGWAPVNSIDLVCIQIRAMMVQGRARIYAARQPLLSNYTFQGAMADLKSIVQRHRWHHPERRARGLPS